jgi:hypothetical protein
MSEVPHGIGALRTYGLKLVDSLYRLSFLSVVGYSAAIVVLTIIALAVTFNFIEVPEFHPK